LHYNTTITTTTTTTTTTTIIIITNTTNDAVVVKSDDDDDNTNNNAAPQTKQPVCVSDLHYLFLFFKLIFHFARSEINSEDLIPYVCPWPDLQLFVLGQVSYLSICSKDTS